MVEINVVGAFNAALENKFNKDIASLKKGDVAVFNITSHGGEVDSLKRMAAKVYALKEQGVEVVTFVPEYAESCGFFFFLLGDHREVAENATVHYHAVRVELEGTQVLTSYDLKKLYDGMGPYQAFCREIFRNSCDIDEDIFSLLENSELPMGRTHLRTLGIIN